MKSCQLCCAGISDSATLCPACLAGVAPNSPEAQAFIDKGIDLGLAGRVEESIASLDRALALGARFDHAVWTARGGALQKLGRNEEAVGAFDHALETDPGNATLWLFKAVSLLNLNRNDEVNAACDRGLTIAPNALNLWRIKKWALRNLGRDAEALDCLRKVIELGGADD